MAWIPTNDLVILSDKLANPRDLFPDKFIHRPILPGLAYIYGKIPDNRTSTWRVVYLGMKLNSINREVKVGKSGKGGIAACCKGHEFIWET